MAVQFIVTPEWDDGSNGNFQIQVQIGRSPAFRNPVTLTGLQTDDVLAQTVVSVYNQDTATQARVAASPVSCVVPSDMRVVQAEQLYVSTGPVAGGITSVNGLVNLFVE